jgi:hypothetical protein
MPDDQGTAGFDTTGASLFFSSDQLEQYMEVARKTLNLALFKPKALESTIVRVEPEIENTKKYQDYAAQLLDTDRRAKLFLENPSKDLGFIDDYNARKQLKSVKNYLPQIDEYLKRPETKTGATLIMTIKGGGITRVRLPVLGVQAGDKYKVRLRAAAYTDAPERFHYLELAGVENQNSTRLGWRKVTGTLDKPQLIEFEFEHPPGAKIAYFIHQRTHQDRGDKHLWSYYRDENGLGTPPGVWVDWAEVEGPAPQTWPTKQAATILFEKPEALTADQYAKEVLLRFAKTAFRGEEASPEFLDKLFEQYKADLANEQKQTEALIGPLSIILSSPRFLYMVESTGSELLSQNELAVRLSYFLWSAPPDGELMQAKLTDSAVLAQQTSRLLADPRSNRFVRGFVYQWLEMQRLDMFQFNGMQFPTWDNAARESAREEIFETVRAIITEKLPLKTLLKADFVYVNDVLAGYYELPGVEGHEFRKVILPADSRRGGLLGTAAVMAMGSDGVRSSPVERGAWVLRHLLNNPPPPAPPNVPQLSRLAGEVLSVRELQKAHQEEPSAPSVTRRLTQSATAWRTSTPPAIGAMSRQFC